MERTLAEMFMASGGSPVELEGESVFLWVELSFARPTRLSIAMNTQSDRPQAICMSAKRGVIEIAGNQPRDVILWADTAPPDVVALATPDGSGPMTLRLWNAWKGGRGVTHAAIGNAGMHVQRRDGFLDLQCSDGSGAAEFRDLHVRVEFGPAPNAKRTSS